MTQATTDAEGSPDGKHSAAESPKRGPAAAIVVVLVVVLLYAASVFAYWFFSGSARELDSPDFGDGSETVVLVTVTGIKTLDNKVDAKVLVIPEDGLTDPRLDVLTEDLSVRLYPWNTLGDLNFPAGAAPAEVTTTIDVSGDPTTWPFDAYKTDAISADVLVGEGDAREFQPARVEIEAAIQGWDISSEMVPPSPQSYSQAGDEAVQLTFKRALGPLAFDIGICLVLIMLPTLALYTSLKVFFRRKEFQMPFLTWYAAMLFAVVPLRNILPGAPPPGAWIDILLVMWVIIGLVASMLVYVVIWKKRID
ncbi:DUF4436 domain-containing protein [Mycolicibacterium sp. BiH015]|uniref:DUF4436 domain-containing protein n=1 Tax=Mycolicibacterium sp. BiH015 TaxID=3018808 RepID=UPI0022E25D8A|nr:DUF4436 domain-containing protein [Mycolicibacterium sp. BiH015]MDA2890303.1 DUF4436 domain-containing protein [Mycolicibacterium sp. BiH015]